MRIIGGTLGGRVIKPPLKKWPTRPTTDIAKEALYNILANRLDFIDLHVLDLFGGTGAHTLECLSRGSVEVTYVDAHGPCAAWFKKEIFNLGLKDRTKILKMDVAKFIKRNNSSFDLIIADPPYALPWLNELPDLIFNSTLVKLGGLVILEHGSNLSFDSHAHFTEDRKYGQSRFSFFS